MKYLLPFALLSSLFLSACSDDNPTRSDELDLISFDLGDEMFSQDFTVLTFFHRDLSAAKIIEIYRYDQGIYSPIGRSNLLIEEGKMVLIDPTRYWRAAKLQCPELQIVAAVLP
jgi:hypothetical protein